MKTEMFDIDVNESMDGKEVHLLEGFNLLDESLIDVSVETGEEIIEDLFNQNVIDSVVQFGEEGSDVFADDHVATSFQWEVESQSNDETADEDSHVVIDLTGDDLDSAETVIMDEEDAVEAAGQCEVDLTIDDDSDNLQAEAVPQAMEQCEICSSDVSVSYVSYGDATSSNSLSSNDDSYNSDEFVASGEDVVAIERMLQTGSGIYGHSNCKLCLESSLGVFLKEGEVIEDGECVTKYTGRNVISTMQLTLEEQLRTIEVYPLIVVGTKKLENGDGFGSFINSSVNGRTHSFMRFVVYDDCIYAMACISKSQYPLKGYMELYLTAGHEWWSLYHSVHDD